MTNCVRPIKVAELFKEREMRKSSKLKGLATLAVIAAGVAYMAATAPAFAQGKAVTFMAREGCGLICVPMLGSRLDELKLPMMVRENTSGFGTAFTITVDATDRHGVTTGISAHDRAKTIEILIGDDERRL